MAALTPKDFYEQYQNEEISVSPFTSVKMGLLPGQTSLRIDTYTIACVPYRLAMSNAKYLASFSREEMAFFQRYMKGLIGVTQHIQPANSLQPIKIFARCTMQNLMPMPGRETVGIISVEWKPCPPDLIAMIGDYLMLLERLKQEYGNTEYQPVPINGPNTQLLGYNNFAELTIDKAKHRVAVFLLGTNRLDFLIPLNGPPLDNGQAVMVKLYFKSFQFMARGKVAEVLKLPNGAQKIRAELDFCVELVDILERFRFPAHFDVKPDGDPA